MTGLFVSGRSWRRSAGRGSIWGLVINRSNFPLCERVGGVGFVTPQVIRPESPPQSLKIHRVPPSFPFPRNFQNAQNNFDGRPFLNTPPFLPKFLELRLAMRSIPRRHTGHRALRGAGVLRGPGQTPNPKFAVSL